MRRLGTILTLLLAVTGVRAEDAGTSDKLGKAIEPILPVKWTDVRGEKATVVFFLSFDCPNSTGYTQTMLHLADKFGKEKIKFVGICESEHSADELKAKAAEFKLTFPVFADPKMAIADAFKATVTPEVFVLDHNSVMRYRGRIDNTYQARLKKNPVVDQHDLMKALEDSVANKPIRTPVTKAVGCGIGAKETVVKTATKLTYHKDVAPILQKNCQGCHRPGEVGPFSLMTYKQAVNWAEDIRDYTARREMPPWKPVENVPFHNDRRMSDADIKTLAEWADGGTPEGAVTDAPPPMKAADGWQLGKPDLILTTGDFEVGPSGPDSFRCFVMPTNLDEDKYIIGFEVKPGNPQIVHHSLNYWDITGKARELEAKAKDKASPDDRDHGPGYSAAMGLGFFPAGTPRPGTPPIGNFGGWAPGQLPRFLPEGTGYLLPKGADVVVQVHYHRNGKPEKDKTQIGVYFAKKKIDRPYQTVTVGPKGFLLIPPNKDDYKVQGTAYMHTDATLHSVMPHMHLIGKTVKVTMTPPGEKPVTLVDIHDWDYNWQETYWLKEPMKIKAGTKLDIEAVFDNSTRNPNNPRNPPAYVMFGEQTTNEMLFGFFGMTTEPGQRVFARQTPPTPEKSK
ncbi:redoxin domain-containing protein [Zavarzinella formosa]|uniref:redoxin domain-containing protein n=1 Tax=Zavarzinella formosa TaxID=360055 RepID=UPI0002DD044D|nr:redoxin domain-containing protein [Zavarzinella formosa]